MHWRNRLSAAFSDVKEAVQNIDPAPTEMFICEINALVLHANQPYIFRVHPGCEKCKAYFGGVQ